MSNYYVSPPSSNGGLPESPSLKPTLNEESLDKVLKREPEFVKVLKTYPAFVPIKKSPLVSRIWGRPPFFRNAKPAAMLERGWIQPREYLVSGQKGLYTEKDGDEVEATVKSRVRAVSKRIDYDGQWEYTLQTENGNFIKANEGDRYEAWDFYTATTPVPFVPRKGGSKKRKSRKHRSKKRKTRRKA
jgi:hypothetical protein